MLVNLVVRVRREENIVVLYGIEILVLVIGF